MADQNKHNKTSMNTFADDIDRNPVLTELERIGATVSRKGIQRSQLEDRIRSEGQLLNDLLAQGRSTPSFASSPFYQEQTQALRDSIRGIRSKMNTLDTSARSRAESEASNYIARQFGSTSINTQAGVFQKEAATQNKAFSMSGQSFDELEMQRQDVLASIRVRERNVQNEIKNLFTGRGQVDPEKSAAIGVMTSGMNNELRQLATINAAQVLQKASGQDPNSRIRSLAEMGEAAKNILSADSIAQEVKSGGVDIMQGGKMSTVANQDVSREIINQARLLANALKELQDGVGKTDEELAKLRNTADESAANLDKLQKAESGGGGGRGTVMSYLSAAGGSFNALGGAANQVLVGQRMQQVANTAGFAGLANQQYDMYAKARGGDIASQLMLTQFNAADQFGMEMKRGTNVAQSAYIAAGGLQVAAGGLQVAEGIKNAPTLGYLNSGVGNNLAQGAQNVIQGASTMGVTAIDMAKGISGQAARLQGIQAQIQARQAINYVGARQAQGLRDYFTGLDVAGQGAGFGANSFLDASSSGAMLSRLSNARMSPEQLAQMSTVGFQQIGSTFNTDQIFSARNLERKGFGSISENMQRMATLSNAGANNPQAGMESVLSAAVARGLDTSKSINLMVDHTAGMMQASAQSTAAGIDNTSSISSLLAANTNPNAINKEFALNRAAQISDITNQVTGDTSVSYTGMVNTARISQATGLSSTDSLFAAKLTSADIRSLQNMDPAAAEEALLKKGIDPSQAKGGVSGLLQSLLISQTNQMFTGSGALAFGSDDERNSLVRSALSGTNYDKLSKEQKALLGKIGSTSDLAGDEYYQGAAGITNIKNVPNTAGKSLTSDTDLGGKKSDFDTLRTGGFKQLSDAAVFASANLEKFGGAIKVFTDLQQKFEKGGMESEKEFSEAGSKFAETFSTSTKLFSDSVSEFEKAVQKLSNNAGLRSNGIPAVPNFVTDMMNQKKGSTRGN